MTKVIEAKLIAHNYTMQTEIVNVTTNPSNVIYVKENIKFRDWIDASMKLSRTK